MIKGRKTLLASSRMSSCLKLCGPFLICEKNKIPLADQPAPVFFGECQTICVVLDCERCPTKKLAEFALFLLAQKH